MDLLLDVDVVIDICTERQPYFAAARDAVALCQSGGGRVWVYVGSVPTLDRVMYDAVARASLVGEGQSSDGQIRQQARMSLKTFCADKQWLAALASEGDVFAADNPGSEQMLRALDRFPVGTARLLTRDSSILDAYPERTISPADYCGMAEQRSQIDFIDLRPQQDGIRSRLEASVHRVLHHGQYIMGPEVGELEKRLAEYVGVSHCVTASSGTDTLLIAMMALGIGPGDEVITTPFTFVATGEMIALLGAVPVFVDIDPRTYNIDPDRIEAAVTPKTKAIMPVSLYGQCADMDAINAIANKYGLPVIEDAAQSFGATYKGRKSCALSTIGSTSFFPSKPLGAYGDGGALFTNDDGLAKAMREIRVHGQDRRYHHPRVGINGRLDTIQAAVLLAKLGRFEWEVQQRQKIGATYTTMLASRCPSAVIPHIEPHNTSVYAQYTIRLKDRNVVARRLNELGIPTAVHYPVPLNRQPAYQAGCRSLGTEKSDEIAGTVLSLPMSPDLTTADQCRVVDALAAIESSQPS